MRDADIDLARLQARKDAIIARFEARSYTWQALQGGAIAVLGAAMVGQAQHFLTTEQALSVTVAGVAGLLLAAAVLARQERALKEEMNQVYSDMQSLKNGGSP